MMLGLAVMSVPLCMRYMGSQRSEELIAQFEQMADQEAEKEHEEKEKKGENASETAISKEDAATLSEEDVIGLIEIEALELKYAILEGTGSKELSRGIGHIPDTAGIGESGNCVLAGHRGSRYGTYFKYLNELETGDVIKLTDKEGKQYLYTVESMEVVDPYDNSVKEQGENTELTLLTCEKKGTMRLIVKCQMQEAE